MTDRTMRPSATKSEHEAGTEKVEREKTETEATGHEALSCPECGGQLVHDEPRGETVCEDCGLVVAEDELDTGPEWRVFDAQERDEKSRAGAPRHAAAAR